MLQEAYRHHKAVAAWGTGVQALEEAGIDLAAPGVVTGPKAVKAFHEQVVTALAWHRHWDR